jgi:hypothetical protein
MKTRVLVFLCAVAIGVTVAALRGILNSSLLRAPSAPVNGEFDPTSSEKDTGLRWQRIDMAGQASFSIPLELTPAFKHPEPTFKALTNKVTLWFSMRQLTKSEPSCDFYAKRLASKESRFESTVVDGKEAILERRETIPFDIEQEQPILKGIIFCVPPSEGSAGFTIVGKYKTDDDYQVLQKIIDSIKFTSPHN